MISIHKLKDKLEENSNRDISELNELVYGIVKDESPDMKENAKRQREFFKVTYNLLIGRDTGPRLATFLWSIDDKDKVVELLDV